MMMVVMNYITHNPPACPSLTRFKAAVDAGFRRMQRQKIMTSRSDSGSGEDSLDRLLPHAGAPRRKSATSLSKTEPPLLRTGTRTIYTAGRPPWYDEHGAQSKEAFVIGLCGGSASGKTTVANKIIEALDVPWVVLLSMDSFYKVLSPEEQLLAAQNDYNFDHPGAFDFELLVATLRKLFLYLVFSRALLASVQQTQPLPQTLSVLESSPQVRGLHTIIRNRETSRDEFIFYSKRLMRLLIEHALTFLPSQPCVVQTPQGPDYDGRSYKGKGITGVSILRAGETMEPALRAVCKDVRIGKILIQTNMDSGEPELHYLRLPKDISEDHVILMDSTVSTGAAAMMAVRVLLDHEVQEEKIMLVSLLMAELGVHSVAYAFPKVKIITTAVDKDLDESFHVIPGIGDFGDRYFGTDGSVENQEQLSV